MLAVKTHEHESGAMNIFNKVIMLVRDPYEAIQAEFNRQYSANNHTGYAPEFVYNLDNGKIWRDFVYNSSSSVYTWENTYIYWYYSFLDPSTRYVIYYHDLVHNTEHELRKVLEFLKTNVTEKEMKCALKYREGSYHRTNKKIGVEIFVAKMRHDIDQIKSRVYKMLNGGMRDEDRAEILKINVPLL